MYIAHTLKEFFIFRFQDVGQNDVVDSISVPIENTIITCHCVNKNEASFIQCYLIQYYSL